MSDRGHILVVDDERSMREFLQIFFEREGYKVTTAPGVDEAEVCLENDEIDIVITRRHVLQGNWQALYDEVKAFREACGDAHVARKCPAPQG